MNTIKRIIPVLTILNQKLVKTQYFRNPRYIGDPINALKIFNEKKVDEIILLDIGASKFEKSVNFKFLKDLASECFIPFAYGGGVASESDAENVFKCGVEKVIINTAAMKDMSLIATLSKNYGSQSVVVCIDYNYGWFNSSPVAYSKSGQLKVKSDIIALSKEAESNGAGELMLQDIGRDGSFRGYDKNFIVKVTKELNIPVIACGGAKDKQDCVEILNVADAAAAGSCFVFKNNNRDSILINYF